ncbi:hypothetical protein [uncultured Dubosiella sp.]|uniref:hypothetical protein n=1 Tax=uncultured Dubosiella sp. TaxID=1937011 RepID=UPI0025B55049|nr:hypothetical protein [uncultured Dubosiella sp.]
MKTPESNTRISNARMASELKRLPVLLMQSARQKIVLEGKRVYIVAATLSREITEPWRNRRG